MNSNTIKNNIIFAISTLTLYILTLIPLNYIWGTFNSYFRLISGAGFPVWMINPVSYAPFIFYWLITGTLFFKIPSLVSLFFLTTHKKNRIVGILFYQILMLFFLGYFYFMYGMYVTCLYCFGWVLGMMALYYNHISLTLFSSMWLSHAVGTILHNYLIPQSASFYSMLAPISFCERLTLWSLSVALYYVLYLLFQSSLIDMVSKRILFFYNKNVMKGSK